MHRLLLILCLLSAHHLLAQVVVIPEYETVRYPQPPVPKVSFSNPICRGRSDRCA